jgi:hypothetical protein
VRTAISLGSPLRNDPGQPPLPGIRVMYRALAGPASAATHQARARSRAMRAPPPAPSTCIYSESDGLVTPEQATLDGNSADHENICVSGSHMGLPFNAQVMWVIADRLMQPEGAWRPFDVSALPELLRRGVDAHGATAVGRGAR